MNDTPSSPDRPKLSLKKRPPLKHKKRSGLHSGGRPAPHRTQSEPRTPSGPKMKNVLSSRSAAFHILTDIITHHKILADAVAAHHPLTELEQRDRSFARLLIATCLRRNGQIASLLAPLVTPETDTPTRIILMIGIAQLVFIGTEAHASIDTTVELAKHVLAPRRSGMVNAVLRRLQRELNERLAATNIIENLPRGLASRWRDAWGANELNKLAEQAMAVPPLDIAVKKDAAFWAETLGGQVLTSQIVRCPPLGDIRAIPGYDEGAWWIQDAAAALPAEMLIASQGGSLNNKTVLDLCAAPGGKTAQLAAAGARVCAVEKDPDRLALLNDNLSRLSLSAEVVKADILDYTPPHQSDFIILDAPCSATGTFRRHPDIFLHKKAPDLVRLQQTQIALLERSLNWVVDDGALLYVTCSLQPEEGEEVIETILATGQARLLPFTENELGIFAAACHPKGWARILPSCLDHISSQSVTIGTGCDGFFVARLQPVRS